MRWTSREYANKLKAGTIKLQRDHIAELGKIKEPAIKNSNLEMAVKAVAKIKELQAEIGRLDPPPDPVGKFPRTTTKR